MLDIRAEVKEEIDRMSDKEVRGLRELLATYPDASTAAVRRVPYSDEPVTDEERRSIEEFELFLKNGGKCIPHDEMMRRLGLD